MTRRRPMPRLSRFLYFYPFTVAGTLLLSASLVLLATGLARRNPYGLFLGLLALAVLGALAVAGRIQAGRAARAPLTWDSSATLTARRRNQTQSIHGDPAALLPFFRHHFRLSGTLTVGKGASLWIVRDVSFASGRALAGGASPPGASQPVPLHVPLCGPLTCRGRFAVRDLFGLTCSRYGEDPEHGAEQRRLTVQPASWSLGAMPPIDPSVGLEEKSRRRTSDEERYYMREYMPGDRFRDINWKVSSRLDELITRISPLTQEKTTVVEVAFRNFRETASETVESLAHLNVLKSWLLSFLRRMKSDHPQVQFRIQTAANVQLVSSEEEVDRFAWELAGEFFAREAGASRLEPAAGELFVFSTPFDRGLARFLAEAAQTRVHLFRTAFPAAGQDGGEPLRLLGDPLEDLPGGWVLRRERTTAGVSQPAPRPSGSLTQEAFAVRVY